MSEGEDIYSWLRYVGDESVCSRYMVIKQDIPSLRSDRMKTFGLHVPLAQHMGGFVSSNKLISVR